MGTNQPTNRQTDGQTKRGVVACTRLKIRKNIFFQKTRPDTRAKTVRQALLILRPIPSSIGPIPTSIVLTVDEYDNE